jgi:hypothetical protein
MSNGSFKEAVPVAIAAGAVESDDLNSGQYLGFTARETAGSAAVVTVYDGTDDTGPILDTIALTANDSDKANYPRPGRLIESEHLFVVITGTVSGSLFT